MNKYLRIYFHLMRLSVSAMFAYRINFVNSIISSLVWSTFGMLATFLLTSRTSHVFGWSRNELLVLAAGYNIFFGLFYLFFSRNFAELTRIIHYGQLDGYLLRPLDSQFSLTCWYQGFHQITRIIVGSIFLVYLLNLIGTAITFWSILYFVAFLLLGMTIVYSIWFMVSTITIWFTDLSNLVDFMYSVNVVTKYPQQMYKGFSEYLYIAFFPLTLALVIPVKGLLQKVLFGDLLALFLTAILVFFISRKFWQFALRFYTSASG